MAKKPTDLATLHATAIGQFKFISLTEQPQRARELEALAFEAGDQWPADAKASRAGVSADKVNGTPAIPARPMLTMRTLDQPLAQITSMAQNADLGIKIVPKDGQANKDTADVIAGLVRSIEADSFADEVYRHGFQRMRACGRGYWRVNKAYASESGGFDQVLRIEPIENGASTYLDPTPKWQPSGGFWEPEFGFITQDLSEAEYKRQYGASKLANASESEILTTMGDDRKQWVIDVDGGERYYRIAEYFYAVYTTRTEKSETDPSVTRDIRERKIMWAKMNGIEFLDPPQEWDGHFIPIIPDIGNKFNVGGEVIYEGMIQPNMAPCRMLNYMVSSAAEKIGLGSLAPWIGVAGQFEGFEAWWDQANVRNFSKLEYNALTDRTGPNLLPPPTRNNDEPAIQAFGEMIGLFTNFIRSTTGVPDAALGNVNPNDKSGKAIAELRRASEQGASNWLTYHARAIRQTGVILVDLLPFVYDTPGRVERILGVDGAEESVMLNAPFVRDEQGQPQPAPQQGLMGRMGSALGITPKPKVEEHNLAQGKYAVVVSVGKSAYTKRQETMLGMSALAQAAPELVPRFADLWVKAMDIPEADAIADRVKPPGVGDPNGLPPEAQAQIQQLQQALEEAKQMADANQAKITIAAHSDATKLKVADIGAQTQVTVAEIKAGMEDMNRQLQILSTMIGTQQTSREAGAGRAHELAMATVGQSHEDAQRQRGTDDQRLMASEQGDRESAMAEQQAERERLMAEEQAAPEAAMAQAQAPEGPVNG